MHRQFLPLQRPRPHKWFISSIEIQEANHGSIACCKIRQLTKSLDFYRAHLPRTGEVDRNNWLFSDTARIDDSYSLKHCHTIKQARTNRPHCVQSNNISTGNPLPPSYSVYNTGQKRGLTILDYCGHWINDEVMLSVYYEKRHNGERVNEQWWKRDAWIAFNDCSYLVLYLIIMFVQWPII